MCCITVSLRPEGIIYLICTDPSSTEGNQYLKKREGFLLNFSREADRLSILYYSESSKGKDLQWPGPVINFEGGIFRQERISTDEILHLLHLNPFIQCFCH